MQKSKTSINEKAVKRLVICDKSVNRWNYKLIIRKGDSYFSFSELKRKHYEDDVYQSKGLGSITYTASELIDFGNIIENNIVYVAPRVIIDYIDNTSDVKYFKTYEEANNYFNIVTNKFNLIEL